MDDGARDAAYDAWFYRQARQLGFVLRISARRAVRPATPQHEGVLWPTMGMTSAERAREHSRAPKIRHLPAAEDAARSLFGARSMLRLVAFLFLLVVRPADAADNAADYRSMIAAAKKGDGPIDWQALRFAYAETTDFDLFGTLNAGTRKKMWELFEAGNFAAAAAEAGRLLERDYVDIDAHMICSIAYGKLGDAAQEKLHRDAVVGILESIRTGDGLTPATAFTVISTGEEYGVLHALGLHPKRQNLVHESGHAYDRLDVADRDGKPQSLYFMIDRVLAAEAKALKKPAGTRGK
jgi:hypothetical protein